MFTDVDKLSLILQSYFQSIGLVWGYMEQKFSYTVYTLGVGFAVALVVSSLVFRRNYNHKWRK